MTAAIIPCSDCGDSNGHSFVCRVMGGVCYQNHFHEDHVGAKAIELTEEEMVLNKESHRLVRVDAGQSVKRWASEWVSD